MAGFALAQNTTSSDHTNFDVNQIGLSERVAWCNDQTTNCPKLCGGPKFTKENTCIAMPFSLSCTCANGTAPGLANYANTWDSDECQARFAACRIQNPGSQDCIACGTLKADDVPASTSSAAAASTTAATSTSAGSSATGAGAANPGSSGKSAAPGVMVGAEMGLKGAVGLLALMGLIL
ncbi:MAG: hypothetical protein LQ352_005938 [Teloschistes flavicans]|nr:MAG: hypothetical protein LQ352_005938 [Teloschistes flavicans]